MLHRFSATTIGDVLSLPFSLRFVVAFDRELCRQVRTVFMDCSKVDRDW